MIRKLIIGTSGSEWELDLATSDKPAAVRHVSGRRETKEVHDRLLEWLHAVGNRSGSRSLRRTDEAALQEIAKKIVRA